jgi:hypothetical protein
MTDRKKPGVAFWATVVVVVVLVAYPLSFGLACWIVSRAGGETAIERTYRPIVWACRIGPKPFARTLNRYCYAGARPGWYFGLPRYRN